MLISADAMMYGMLGDSSSAAAFKKSLLQKQNSTCSNAQIVHLRYYNFENTFCIPNFMNYLIKVNDGRSKK